MVLNAFIKVTVHKKTPQKQNKTQHAQVNETQNNETLNIALFFSNPFTIYSSQKTQQS